MQSQPALPIYPINNCPQEIIQAKIPLQQPVSPRENPQTFDINLKSNAILPEQSDPNDIACQNPMESEDIDAKAISEPEKRQSEILEIATNEFLKNIEEFKHENHQLIQKYVREYMLQYMTIIYHIQCLIDLKKALNLQNALTSIYGNPKFHPKLIKSIISIMISHHEKNIQQFQTTREIIMYMIYDMRITQDEYDAARIKIAEIIRNRYDQLLVIIPSQDHQFRKALTIKTAKYKQNVQDLLANQDDLKKIFGLFKFVRDLSEEEKISTAQKLKLKQEQLRKARRQKEKLYRQNSKKRKIAQKLQRQKQQAQKHQRMRRNNIVHIILMQIYSRKYDVEKNNEHIGFLVRSIVSQMDTFDEDDEYESSIQIILHYEKASKKHHQKQINYKKGVAQAIARGHERWSEESRKKVKSQIAQNYFKIWYEKIVGKVTFPKGLLLDLVQDETAKYQKDPEAFIDDAQNLMLLDKFLQETFDPSKTIERLSKRSEQGKWTSEMVKKCKKFRQKCKEKNKVIDQQNFRVCFMQFLVDDFRNSENDVQIDKMSLLHIITKVKERWIQSPIAQKEAQKQEMVDQKKYPNEEANKTAQKEGMVEEANEVAVKNSLDGVMQEEAPNNQQVLGQGMAKE